MRYLEPEMEVICLEADDVVTASNELPWDEF